MHINSVHRKLIFSAILKANLPKFQHLNLPSGSLKCELNMFLDLYYPTILTSSLWQDLVNLANIVEKMLLKRNILVMILL